MAAGSGLSQLGPLRHSAAGPEPFNNLITTASPDVFLLVHVPGALLCECVFNVPKQAALGVYLKTQPGRRAERCVLSCESARCHPGWGPSHLL